MGIREIGGCIGNIGLRVFLGSWSGLGIEIVI